MHLYIIMTTGHKDWEHPANMTQQEIPIAVCITEAEASLVLLEELALGYLGCRITTAELRKPEQLVHPKADARRLAHLADLETARQSALTQQIEQASRQA